MATSVTSSEPLRRPFTSSHTPGNQPDVGMVAAVSVCATLLVVVFVGAILYLLRRRLTCMDLRHDVESGSYHRTEKTDTSATALSRLVAANILARYEKLQLWGWGDDTVAVPIDQIYTEMRWVERVHTIAGTKVQTLSHYTDMFSEVLNQHATRNVILGDPGVGKTTFAYRLLVDWSRAMLGRKDSRITPEIHARLVSMRFVVPIFLREVKENQALNDIIADQLSLDSEEASALWMYIQNHKSQVLFVLEGYDEFDEDKCKYLADMVRGQRLFGVHLVTTLRTYAFSSVITNTWAVTGRLHLTGFSCEGVKNYIHRYFSSIEGGQNKAEELIGRISKQEELQRFSRFPAVLLLMCKLWQEEGSLKDTLTSFYTDILIYMCGRYEKKTLPIHKRAPTISILKRYRKEILAIGKLALQALSGKHLQLLFPYEYVKALGDIAKNLGFFRIIQGANGCVRAEFHHKTLQEYFAAFYIVNCGSDDGLQHLLRVCSISKCLNDCKVIITFVCGMSRKMGNKVRQRIEKVSRTWDSREEVSAKDRTDFLATFLSENSSVVFPLPAEIELEPGKYTQSILDRFFSMDATAVTSVILNTKYLAHISQIRKLNITALETLEVNATTFSVGGPVKVDEDSLLELAKYKKIDQLKVKQVRGNDNFTVLTHILSCVKCVQIDTLDLNLNKFGVKGLEGLAEILPLLRGLKQLWLRACQCDDHLAWSRFFPSLSKVPELEIINLSLNSIGADAIDILSQQLPKLTKLHDLRLQSCGICCCCTALNVLEQLPKVPTLKKLDFCDNGLGDGLLKLTMKKFSLEQLDELNLGQNRLSDDVKTQLKAHISQEYQDLALKL